MRGFTPLAIGAFAFAALCAASSHAQSLAMQAPQNVLQLSASGAVEVASDLLVLTLAANTEAADASDAQAQLTRALDAALAQARSSAQAAQNPGQMDVRTGQFSLYPRYGQDGKIKAWQGRAELVLEGRDFSRITESASRIRTMVISQVGFALSNGSRAKAELEAQAQAIEQFKGRAAELARSFGFTGYTLREVTVNSSQSAPGPRPRLLAMAAAGSDVQVPVPVEAGKTQVVISVSGSVQMR